jgi:hypothetical protein
LHAASEELLAQAYDAPPTEPVQAVFSLTSR